jgi:hypothetical protein
MRQDNDAMKTALRVLMAVVERREPEPADVDKLRPLASLPDGAPPDELARDVVLRACEAIQETVKRREELRRAERRAENAETS